MITPQPLRFHEGGDRGRLLEAARRAGHAITIGDLVRAAGVTPSLEVHQILNELVDGCHLRRVGPGTFKYLAPPATEDARVEPLRVSLPRSEVEKEATPVVAAPPSAPTPPPSAPARREAIASAARRPQPPPAPTSEGDRIRALPLDDTPPRHRPSPPKEKPMPATTALERARALRAQQEQLVKELQVELADLEGRAAEIRVTLAELGAETTTPKVVRNGDRKATPRAQKPRAATGKGSLADRVLALVQQGKGTSAGLVAATGKPQGSVGAALVALQKRGQVKRVGRGKYEAAA
jgi:hypothetical protein